MSDRRVDLSRLQAILLDLDDTLLDNNMDSFMPAYFELLSAYVAERYDPRSLIRHLLAASEVMAGNTDPTVTNEDAFWGEFIRLTGFDRLEAVPFLNRFYHTRFEEIRKLTRQRPKARPLVELAFNRGWSVVIATNPMFPRIAIERRLVWAGVGAEEFDYDLITTFENMHATKPHLEYYREIMARLGCVPDRALMVGDDWERDIAPASELGLFTFWIAHPDAPLPDAGVALNGRGTLADLMTWLVAN